jgi:hypothetical protein
MANYEERNGITQKLLTDAEGIDPNDNDQANGNPDGRAGGRVPKTDESSRRRQFG